MKHFLSFYRNKTKLLMLSALLIVWAVGSFWIIRNTDRQLREDLLIKEHLVTQTLSTESINGLSGTQADLVSPD